MLFIMCKVIFFTAFFISISTLIILSANAQSCRERRPYCKNIPTCKDAVYYLVVCGDGTTDRDGDGIPCEDVCGDKLTPQLKSMKEKIKLQGETKLGLLPKTATSFQCGLKKSCREMTTCKEATFYFKNCSLKKLDKDKDGKPCNRLCK